MIRPNRNNSWDTRRCGYCYYGNSERWQRNKYSSDFDAWM